MTLPDDAPHQFVDRMMRQTLTHPDNLRSLLLQVVPHLAAGFDCGKARLLEREFPLDDWRHREADLPFEIPYRLGTAERWALVCVLLEHQSDTDPLIPLRLLYFAVVYWERQWYEWERLPKKGRPALTLAPVLPIVLYTGARPWGSNRKLIQLLGEPKAFHVFAPAWEPLFWNVADQSAEALLHSGEAWLQLLAVIRSQEADAANFVRVFGEVFGRVQNLHGEDHPRWYDLLRAVWAWGHWRRPPAERAGLAAAAEASQTDLSRRQEVQVMANTIAEALLEEGMAKGREEGMAKGALLEARELLRGLLEERFGALPEALRQRIEGATDLARLRAACRQSLHLTKVDELVL